MFAMITCGALRNRESAYCLYLNLSLKQQQKYTYHMHSKQNNIL